MQSNFYVSEVRFNVFFIVIVNYELVGAPDGRNIWFRAANFIATDDCILQISKKVFSRILYAYVIKSNLLCLFSSNLNV